MPKATTQSKSAERRHIPLADEILTAGHLRTKSGKRKSRSDEDDEGAEHYIDSKASKKILQIGRDLAEEDAAASRASAKAAGAGAATNSAFDFGSRFDFGGVDEEDDGDAEKYADAEWEDEEEVEEVEIDPQDLDMFHKFLPRDEEDPIFDPRKPGDEEEEGEGTNLADLILEKIAAHEAAQAKGPIIMGGGAPEDAVELPAKAIEVFEKIAFLLSRYKSGPLPKPFKVLPTLPQWETLLSITQPDKWTPNAVYAATRIFISSKPHIAQQYINIVLLDRVRDEIHETKKLNVHIYNALKKALYKPACFFKGLLFPLVASGTCTLREAQIVSSVVTRISIPVLHSAAALLRLCDIAAEQSASSLAAEAMGATNIFIRVFLDKKYALPYKVIDALVFHFIRFRSAQPYEDGDAHMMGGGAPPSAAAAKAYKLPVLWHQSLLVFAQRYRNDITEDQREALLDLILVRGHKDIGPEVRRELLAGRGRGVPLPQEIEMTGDDTMDMTA